MNALRYMPALLLVTLAGCQATAGTAAYSALQASRDVRSELSNAAIDYLCNGMTLRDWRAHFGRTKQSATAWTLMCGKSLDGPPPIDVPADADAGVTF